MSLYPESLNRLIEQFQKLPSIGRKSAERLAMYMVEADENEARDFADAILSAKEKIHPCKICGNLTEDEICGICRDVSRDESTICLVEDVRALQTIEKSSIYHGLYHVLGGLISPSEDLSADKLNVDSLLERVDEGGVKEVILAISSTIEGETTSLFLDNLLVKRGVKVTRIASGIPVGSNLEYFDQLTLQRALEDRREIKD